MGQLKGTYVLMLELTSEKQLQIGKLGRFRFSGGYYLYIGSARGGLEARIRRHFRRQKPLRWHIDCLRQSANILEA